MCQSSLSQPNGKCVTKGISPIVYRVPYISIWWSSLFTSGHVYSGIYLFYLLYNKIACFFFCYKNFSLGDNLIFFCLSRLIFQLPTDLEKNSQLSQVVRKKRKKYLKKEKAIRKWHTIFSFSEFKIGANWFSITFFMTRLGDLAFIFLKCGCGTKKSCQTWKFGLKYFWNVLFDQCSQN